MNEVIWLILKRLIQVIVDMKISFSSKARLLATSLKQILENGSSLVSSQPLNNTKLQSELVI